nr:bacteriohopanetetrol glucosamine biosynthesis glycosyltransferase HpnI [Paraburkholderia bannensis]
MSTVAPGRRVVLSLVLLTALGLVLLCAKKNETPDFSSMLLNFLAIASGIGVVGALSYTIFATSRIVQFFSQAPVVANCFPDVTILKPLHGDEWQLAAHLESFIEQDYPGKVQYIFGVHDGEDKALATLELLRHRYPGKQISVVIDTRLYGPNRKIANLVNMLEHATSDVLCFADSDVLVTPDYLRAIVSELQVPGVGLVTTVYRGRCSVDFWAHVAGALTDYHFLPGVITGLALGRARPCFGQSIAMMRGTLAEIGGLVQFAHHLAEDHAIGEAVRRAGKRVTVLPKVVLHACTYGTFLGMFRHELRWSRTIRAADRWGHAGAILMHPLPLAILTTIFSQGADISWIALCASLGARVALVYTIDRVTCQRSKGLLWLPLWDVLQFVIYIASFCSSSVVWRGTRFRVDRSGMLSPDRER